MGRSTENNKAVDEKKKNKAIGKIVWNNSILTMARQNGLLCFSFGNTNKISAKTNFVEL